MPDEDLRSAPSPVTALSADNHALFRAAPRARPGEHLLVTKLLVPSLGPEVVARPRLIERLNEATRRRVTLVAAPAGFGKTTAVAAWIAETRPPVAWLALDEGDNELGRFLAHLVGAVRARWPDLGAHAAAQLDHAPLRGPAILGALLNDLATQGSPIALVLDDFEVVQSQEVLEAVTFVLDHQPPKLHLVLCTRREPRLPLPRLRAHGQLADVTVDDLRFTLDEAAGFLEGAMALRLSPLARRTLHDRTEGWIAGLRLAALSLRLTVDRARFIASFAGDHRHVADYLMDEVLRRQPPAVQEFLLATSVLRRLCGDLCDAVTGGSGSDAMLDQLAEHNLFLQRLDEQRRWYRYHTLFAELLRHRLVARDPAAAAALNRRAAVWYDEHGLVHDAIHHALAGGDTELASMLVERHGHVLLARGEHRAVVGWLAAMPEEVFERHPELGVFQALVLVGVRDVDGAARRLEWVKRRVAALPAPPAPALMRFLRTVEAIVCLFREEIDRAIELSVEAEGIAGELPPSFAGWTEVVRALAHHARRELREARLCAERGLAAGLAAGVPRTVILMGTLLARLELHAGRLRRAEAACRALLELVTKNGWWEVGLRTVPQLALVEVLYERGALVEAEEALVSAAELTARIGPDEIEDLVMELLAQIRVARGQAPVAVAVDAERAARERYHYHLFEPLIHYQSRRRLGAGEAAKVEAELRQRGVDPHATTPDPAREVEYLLLARALVAGGRSAEALPLLARLLLAAEAEDRLGSALEALCLEAVARHHQGSTQHAQESLRRAIELAAEEGYLRVFLDLGPPMLHLLRRAAATGRGGAAVERLLAAFGDAPASSAVAVPLAEPIRERELEVLRGIATGMSNREIAARLRLSPNTVKTHVRNLYAKLGVEKRIQALRRARELGLIGN